ncbi:MAG: accessory gene regulator B family protein [Clostridium sp.]
MISAETLSNKIGNYLQRELNIDDIKKSIIIYGSFAILQIGISIIFTVIIGYLTNTLVESLIITFSIVLLRKYSGGHHASTPNKCLVFGLIITIIPAILIKNYIYNIDVNFLLLVSSIIMFCSFLIIIKKAPVDNPNKRIKKEEKRFKLRRSSIFILSIYLLIILVLIGIYYKYSVDTAIIYMACIIYAAGWQSFTLTKLAARVINI